VLYFLLLFIFNSSTEEMPGGNGRSGTAVFCENLVAICTHDRRLWIWIWIWMANFISTASLMGGHWEHVPSRSLLCYSKLCQNAPKHVIFTSKKSDNFLRRQHSHQTPSPWGGDPLPMSHPSIIKFPTTTRSWLCHWNCTSSQTC